MNIIITGASRGFGKAIAAKFAADGSAHHFFLCARNSSNLEQTAQQLKSSYPESEFKTYAVDMSVKADVIRFADWVLGNSSSVDILVNNAGIYLPGSVHNEDDNVLEQLIAANLYSAYHLTRRLLPRMMERKHGHIFNMCSIASLQAYANGGAYSISKFALAGFSKNLREELKSSELKVTTVYPGAAYTDSWKGSGVDPQRLMDERDIADMIYAAAHLSKRACVEEILLRPQLGDL
ncbi:MAG: SDR family oxidoreductase [Flavitalea sp.]